MTTGTNLESELAKEIIFNLGDADGTIFTPVPGCLGPGPVGDKPAFKDATTIDMKGYKSKAALAEPEDREVKFKYLRDNTAQDELRALAKNKETRLVRIDFIPLGKSYTFEMVFGGWQLDEPEFNEDINMTIFARKNTNVPTTESDYTQGS